MHTLVLAIPKKANVDARQLESEIDRSNCSAVLAFVMGDPPNAAWTDDARIITARSLADWLTRHGVGVETVTFQVPVLNPWIIESIGGLDT